MSIFSRLYKKWIFCIFKCQFFYFCHKKSIILLWILQVQVISNKKAVASRHLPVRTNFNHLWKKGLNFSLSWEVCRVLKWYRSTSCSETYIFLKLTNCTNIINKNILRVFCPNSIYNKFCKKNSCRPKWEKNRGCSFCFVFAFVIIIIYCCLLFVYCNISMHSTQK